MPRVCSVLNVPLHYRTLSLKYNESGGNFGMLIDVSYNFLFAEQGGLVGQFEGEIADLGYGWTGTVSQRDTCLLSRRSW